MKILQKKLEETEQKLEVTLVKLNEVQQRLQESDKMRCSVATPGGILLSLVLSVLGGSTGKWREGVGRGRRRSRP